MGQRISLIVAIATIFILALLSLFPYIAWSWPLELITHFRYQYLVLSLIVSIILFGLWKTRLIKHKLLIFIALVLLGINVVEVLPWYLPHAQQVVDNSGQKIRLLSLNINIQNNSTNEIIDIVQANQPDIALLLEIDNKSFENLRWQFQDTLPSAFRSSGGGLAIFSRLPLQDVKGDNFNKQGNHNLIATIEIDKQPIKFIGTHPLVPTKPTNFHSRNRQLAALTKYIQQLQQPVILAGDFNLTPWSPYYRRLINKTNLHNTRLGFGILPSWPRPATHVHLPSWLIPLINIPIDHCLVSKHFQVATTYTGANANSDHAALITDLVLLRKS
ncbi:hypothetical protein Nos7524_4738 [Nostoc sp. PCC 7524]|uniref:endonuclease/exonuclease/phosphatase family protein n=1 Tax=Nostoc sp. (strain ATCC 29411 / PCC 7524) TaxID=28072 RepID=UPI00029ED33C|nr:endonuclease/exonuclease/phosphatase family protein [Nostoc sp. PCC 7524]AFY50480.1 hypothetical protein Nos7524_4738 [Nostoc sp. PCC 7524]